MIIIVLILIIILFSFLFTSKYENFSNNPSYPIGGDTTNPDLSNKTNQYNVNIYVSFVQYILLIIIIILLLSLWKR